MILGGAVLALRAGLQGPVSRAMSIGGPFALTDASGQTVTDASFRGKWMLVYFGYTHCPDACPTALSDIAAALDKLGPGAKDVVPVFITVDPERDTGQVMKDYATAFGPEFVGLTGSQAAISNAEKEYRVYAAKHPIGAAGDYEMDHSSIIYVMDPKGRFVANFTQETDPAKMAETLKQLGA